MKIDRTERYRAVVWRGDGAYTPNAKLETYENIVVRNGDEMSVEEGWWCLPHNSDVTVIVRRARNLEC